MVTTEAPGRWVVWHVKHAPCCGKRFVSVYPATCASIQCECGLWIETPQFGPTGAPIVERGLVMN